MRNEIHACFRTPRSEFRNRYDYLVLTKKAEWKLCSFFRCLGLKKHGEPARFWIADFGMWNEIHA